MQREHEPKTSQLFCLRFQFLLTAYLCAGGSVEEGFGVVWERTVAEVPLADEEQGRVYVKLLAWGKSDELFTAPQSNAILHALRKTVH